MQSTRIVDGSNQVLTSEGEPRPGLPQLGGPGLGGSGSILEQRTPGLRRCKLGVARDIKGIWRATPENSIDGKFLELA